MRLKTIFKLTAVGAVALVIALIAVAKSIDVNRYRPFLLQSAQAVLGRDLRIEGPIKLNLSLAPSLVAEDIVLANTPWGSRPEMLRIKRIEAQIGLVPLLFREVAIRRMVLVEPDLLLEQDGKGHANWTFSTAAADQTPSANSTGTPTNFRVGRVSVRDGRVEYKDGSISHVVRIQRFTADADTLISPIGVKLSGFWNDKAIDVSGVLGPVADLLGTGHFQTQPYPIKLKAVLPGMLATIDGQISGDKLGDPTLALKITADAADLSEAAHLLGYDLPALGAARLSMMLGGTASQPSFSDIDAALGRKDAAALTLKGAVKQPLQLAGVDLILTAEGASLAGINKPLALGLPAIGPFKASGRLRNDGPGWKVSDLKTAIGHSDAAGDISFRLDGRRPLIDARLTSTQIDLEELLHSEAPKTTQPDGRLLSDQPMDLSTLSALDGSVLWKSERVKDGPLLAHGVDLSVSLSGGKLQSTANSVLVAGGKAKGKLVIDSAANPPAFAATLNADKIGLGEVLKAFDVTPVLSGGRSDIRLALQGTGRTPHAIAAKLNGETVIVTGQGSLDGVYADALATDVIRQLSPWNKERDAALQCMVGRFVVTDGLAKTETLLLDTSRMTVGGHGSINLNSETIDLTLSPRPKDPSLLSLAMPLDVGGSLMDPSVAPNKGAIVKGVAGAMSSIALGPLGLIVPLVSTGSDDNNPCLAAIAQAQKAQSSGGRKPGKGKKTEPEKTEGGLEGLLQGLLGN